MQELDLVVRTSIVNEFDKRRSEVFDRVIQGEEVFIIKLRNRSLAMCPKPSSVSHFLRKPPTLILRRLFVYTGQKIKTKPNRASSIEQGGIVMNINNVTIVGNLTDPPTAGNMSKGTAANMRLATHFEHTDPGSCEKTKHTDFFDIEAYGKLAENCLTVLQKGDRIVVSGWIRYDVWTDDAGNKRSKAKIRAGVVGKSLEF